MITNSPKRHASCLQLQVTYIKHLSGHLIDGPHLPRPSLLHHIPPQSQWRKSQIVYFHLMPPEQYYLEPGHI